MTKSNNRRTFLKSAGASLGASTVIPVVGRANSEGENSKRDAYQQALFLRKKHDWSVSEFRSYLKKRNLEFKYQDFQKEVPGLGSSKDQNSDGEAGAQEFSKTQLDMSLTITYDRYINSYYVDFTWDFTIPAGVFVDGNLPPKDVVQIEWQGNEVDPDGDPYGSQYVTEHTDAPSTKTAGISMAYDDKEAYFNNPNGDDARYERSWSDYTGTEVNLRDGDETTRDFYIRYYHIYSTTDYSISWTYGAPSVTFYSDSKKWLADGQAYQDEMWDGKNWDCETDSC